jgi:mannan endo-1,4-beta-mannosidase
MKNKMFFPLLLALTFLLTVLVPKNAEATSDGFYVDGTTLYESNGQKFTMRGINVAHTWFKNESTVSLKGVSNTGANTVRLVLSNGQKWQKDSLSEVKRLVEEAKANQLVTILEVHDATGSDNIADLNKAVDYWLELKDILIGNEKYVILNVANEWAGAWNSENWKNGYIQAIPKIRAAGIKNTIMVDAAGWGQYPQSIIDYGTEVFQSDPLKNTLFSIHMYEYAGGNEATVKSTIDNVLNKNLSVVIGEFGAEHSNGDVDENTIMNYSQQKGVGYLGWSWKGNNADLAYLDIAETFDGNSYTSWGETLLYHENGIKNTSKKASIFTGNTTSPSYSYIQYFYGSKSAEPWGQAVSLTTNKNGGPINISDIKKDGYFYVEYTGTMNSIELCLQSWSGGPTWVKITPSETGQTSGGYYAKFSYTDLISNFGRLDLLDQVHVSAKEQKITVNKLQYGVYS